MPEKQEQTLFKDLRRQDIEMKKDETKKVLDISNDFLIKGSWMINGSHPKEKSGLSTLDPTPKKNLV